MTTAVDTSILVDVIQNDPKFGAKSLSLLRDAAAVGRVIACPVVWAEVLGAFERPHEIVEGFGRAGITFDPFDAMCAERAGAMWREYRSAGGTRSRIVADFLIGAHAELRGQRLLTRDRGFYRRYFKRLHILGA